MLIITPEMKDKVLADLLSADYPSFEINYQESEKEYGFPAPYVKLILDDFASKGLIKVTYILGNRARIHMQTKAMDLHLHGGFVGEEEILKGNLEKLGFELEVLAKQLSPDYAEKSSQLAQIASAILQGLVLFH